MEIKDNAFSRQFETTTAQGLVTVEYSFQENILTKIHAPDGYEDEEFPDFKNIMEIAERKEIKVVPILPK
jgi:hypothetical protein